MTVWVQRHRIDTQKQPSALVPFTHDESTLSLEPDEDGTLAMFDYRYVPRGGPLGRLTDPLIDKIVTATFTDVLAATDEAARREQRKRALNRVLGGPLLCRWACAPERSLLPPSGHCRHQQHRTVACTAQGMSTISRLRGSLPSKQIGMAVARWTSVASMACRWTWGSVLLPELPHRPISSPTSTD